MKIRALMIGVISTGLLALPAFAAPPAPTQPAAVHAIAPAKTMHHTKAVRHNEVWRAERELKKIGLYSGRVNGRDNTAYLSALTNFQETHGLRANGRLTPETVKALGI